MLMKTIPGTSTTKENYQFSSTAKETSKQNRIGFRSGLGLEMNLTSFISFGFEVFGRLVNFSNWTGDYADSWTPGTSSGGKARLVL